MGWKLMAIGRSHRDDGDYDEIEEMLEEAYEKGRRKGRKERDEYGERDSYSGGTDYYSGGRGGYGMRKRYYEEDDDDDEYGERRGVKGTGRYSRYRYR